MQTIIQITDLHYDNKDPELVLLRPEDNFNRFISTVRNTPCDHIVLTGDVADTDGPFDMVINRIQELPVSIQFVSGNHDPEDAYRNLSQKKRYYVDYREDFMVLYLDSSKGMIDSEQLRWMEDLLINNSKDILIFVHHPILDCGNTVMDRMFPLLNRNEVKHILHRANNKVSIFCGHYHWDQEVRDGNITQYITPSLLYQLDRKADTLKIGSTNYGYRVIHLSKDSVETFVEYL